MYWRQQPREPESLHEQSTALESSVLAGSFVGAPGDYLGMTSMWQSSRDGAPKCESACKKALTHFR
jgi:hypothetical protein